MVKAARKSGDAAVQGLLGGVLLGGALLVGAPSLLLLLVILLAPGILCMLADQAPGRPVARASLLAGLAFSIGPAWHLWLAGLGFGRVFEMLSDITVPAAAWCACTAGWLACELAPFGVRLVIEAQTERRRRKLTDLRDELVEEWNLRV